MPAFLFVFAQAHSEFRLPELESIAELHGFTISVPADCDPSRPFMVLNLESEEHARLLAARCILIKHVYEFYAQGGDYDELHIANKESKHLWSSYIQDTSFKFIVTAYNHKISESRQREIVESFRYMGFLGKIDMKNPEIILGCFEEYDTSLGLREDRDGKFRQAYFGRLVVDGSARALIKMFDVKKRLYYGNTSMESEVSLLMANQALASPSRFVYDPFCGTGSMAYVGDANFSVHTCLLHIAKPSAYFGAHVFGSDIDDQPPGVLRAAKQYGVGDRIVDLCTFDSLFDAIITDPPCKWSSSGGQKTGTKKKSSAMKRKRPISSINYRHGSKLSIFFGLIGIAERQYSAQQPYLPPTKPYELSLLVADLVVLARYLLKPGGRLVFFLPTVNEQYEEVDIQTMLCEGMALVANSLQDFGSWGRRDQLVTIRKSTHETYPPPSFGEEHDANGHVPAHRDFRDQYFRGFKKESDEV
ncbi:tRNA (Guanine(10)-N2)-methyltransferase [Mycena sanguinolenta]|uniref:tRNA (Guanine(10)-N2)-methyltransferase n=1 Tax=Mycena sanguinolenta TaxID=230812 RepID=A0A8H6ZET8_9AGAR|nr:tRNA (Guanine(10)-N2)-methyltransferase [Mycena sanguinolenta]